MRKREFVKAILDKVNGVSDKDWSEIHEEFNEETPCGVETLRKCGPVVKLMQETGIIGGSKENENNLVYDPIKEIEEKSREMKMERMKLQTEKLENNKWLRQGARDEMIMERIISAIKECPKPNLPAPISEITYGGKKEWILAFGDAHYGKEFCIKGLHGEIINEYSPEIFEKRMEKLLEEVMRICTKENIMRLHVYDLGDFAEGILRVGALTQLRYGVIESTIRYAYFLSEWLNELSSFVKVRFQMCKGNHTELRMLGQPKGTFADENMIEVVRAMIKLRLAGNANFEMVENPSGLIYDKVAGFDVLGVHGECGDLANALHQFSNTYKVDIDYIIGAHIHHRKIGDVGRRRGAFSIKSLIGIDSYSMDLNKTSDPGAAMIGFSPENGDEIHYNIILR